MGEVSIKGTEKQCQKFWHHMGWEKTSSTASSSVGLRIKSRNWSQQKYFPYGARIPPWSWDYKQDDFSITRMENLIISFKINEYFFLFEQLINIIYPQRLEKMVVAERYPRFAPSFLHADFVQLVNIFSFFWLLTPGNELFSSQSTFVLVLHSKLTRKLSLFKELTYYDDPHNKSNQDDNIDDLISKASALMRNTNFIVLVIQNEKIFFKQRFTQNDKIVI